MLQLQNPPKSHKVDSTRTGMSYSSVASKKEKPPPPKQPDVPGDFKRKVNTQLHSSCL